MSFGNIHSLGRLSVNLKEQQGRMNRAIASLSGDRSQSYSVNRVIADRIQTQVRGIAQGASNASFNSARLSTEIAALDSGNAVISEMREIAVEASNDSLSKGERALLQEQFKELHAEVTTTLGSATFNGRQILQGHEVSLQTDQLQTYADADGQAVLNELEGIDLSSAKGASAALDKLDLASQQVGIQNGRLIAAQDAMERATDRAMDHASNLEEAAWSIGDTDLAQNIAEFVAATTAHSATLSVLKAHSAQLLSTLNLLPSNSRS